MFDTRPLNVAPREYVGGVPVFYPTEAEFADFYRYNKAIHSYGMRLGIVKIVPPTPWLKRVQQLYTQQNLDGIVIRNPIVQHINGYGQGVYHQQNMEKGRKYSIWQWKSLSNNLNFQPPKTKLKDNKPHISEPQRIATAKAKLPLPRDQFTIDALEYSQERCQELEKIYWRSLTYAEPMYGADTLGLLFPDEFGPWNVAHLPNILDLLDRRLPGVNDAYLYAGLWKATFAWHLEDQDLYLINYIHFGAPKQWYLIPQSQEKAFFEVMKQEYLDDYNSCLEFLRHKEYMVLPEFLKRKGIEVNRIVHREGEFIITFPYGYHAGFNYGYNLAESVNFALDDWFPFGKVTKKCECTADAVEVNAHQLYCKFMGIPYEYHTPPMLDDETETERKPQPVRRMVKRKLPDTTKPPQTVSVQSQAPKRPKLTVTECTLCPFTIENTPLATDSLFELLPLTTTKMCHRICAQMFPKELTIVDGVVKGLEQILRAQRKLNCTVCRQPGPCFQCAHPKCTRSYHAACGLNDWVKFTQDKGEALCKYHRDRNPVSGITGDGWVQFLFGKTHHVAKLIECRRLENRVVVKLFPQLKETMELDQDQITGFIPSEVVEENEAAIAYWKKHHQQQQTSVLPPTPPEVKIEVKPDAKAVKLKPKLQLQKPANKTTTTTPARGRGRPRKYPKPKEMEPVVPGSVYEIEDPSEFYLIEANSKPFVLPRELTFILDNDGTAVVPKPPRDPTPSVLLNYQPQTMPPPQQPQTLPPQQPQTLPPQMPPQMPTHMPTQQMPPMPQAMPQSMPQAVPQSMPQSMPPSLRGLPQLLPRATVPPPGSFDLYVGVFSLT